MLEVFDKEAVTCIEITVPNFGKVYSFLVDGMLVDTNTERFKSELIPFYESASFDLVALTHSHEDHTGIAPWIQENRNVPIYIHEKGIVTCSQFAPYPEYRKKMWGLRKEFTALPMGDTIESRMRTWKVIYTPGHAEDHIALFHEGTGTLFSGDLFVARKTIAMMRSESVSKVMSSIRTVLTYDIGPMFCCHAGYMKDGRAKLEEKLLYLESLSDKVKQLHEKGLTNEAIDKKVFPRSYPITSLSDGEWDTLHVITSIIEDMNKKPSELSPFNL